VLSHRWWLVRQVNDRFYSVCSCSILHRSSFIIQCNVTDRNRMILNDTLRITLEEMYGQMDVHHCRLNDAFSERLLHQNQRRRPVAAAIIASLNVAGARWTAGRTDRARLLPPDAEPSKERVSLCTRLSTMPLGATRPDTHLSFFLQVCRPIFQVLRSQVLDWPHVLETR
jgi:hypothetical protein